MWLMWAFAVEVKVWTVMNFFIWNIPSGPFDSGTTDVTHESVSHDRRSPSCFNQRIYTARCFLRDGNGREGGVQHFGNMQQNGFANLLKLKDCMMVKVCLFVAKVQKYNILSCFFWRWYTPPKETNDRNLRKRESLKEENQNLGIIVFRVYVWTLDSCTMLYLLSCVQSRCKKPYRFQKLAEWVI